LSKVARVIPIRYPDLTATLSGDGTIDDMAALALQQINAVLPSGEIRLIGYSLGGGVAFEVASRLIAQGRSVKFLGILDTNIGPARVTITRRCRVRCNGLDHTGSRCIECPAARSRNGLLVSAGR